MTYVLHYNVSLNDDQLKAALSELVDQYLQKLGLSPQDVAFDPMKDKVVNKLFNSLTNKETITMDNMANPLNPNYINKLMVYTIGAVLVERNLTDDLKKFLAKVQEIKPDFDLAKINTLDDLKEFLKGHEEQLKPLLTPKLEQQIKIFYENFRADVKSTLTPFSTKPELVRKRADEVTLSEDPYVNLIGLINSRVAGTTPVPVVHNKGNTLGIVDVNAQHGLAPIDEANRLDSPFGDPLGIIDDIVERSLGSGNEIINKMHNTARLAHKLPQNKPK